MSSNCDLFQRVDLSCIFLFQIIIMITIILMITKLMIIKGSSTGPLCGSGPVAGRVGLGAPQELLELFGPFGTIHEIVRFLKSMPSPTRPPPAQAPALLPGPPPTLGPGRIDPAHSRCAGTLGPRPVGAPHGSSKITSSGLSGPLRPGPPAETTRSSQGSTPPSQRQPASQVHRPAPGSA